MGYVRNGLIVPCLTTTTKIDVFCRIIADSCFISLKARSSFDPAKQERSLIHRNAATNRIIPSYIIALFSPYCERMVVTGAKNNKSNSYFYCKGNGRVPRQVNMVNICLLLKVESDIVYMQKRRKIKKEMDGDNV